MARSRNRVYLGGRTVDVTPAMAIGTGGEADVYDIGGGLALKLFKGPDHPDLAGLAAEQQAAVARLGEHQGKLRAFPAGLPDRVVAPRALASRDAHGREVVGYAMALVAGAELLYRWAEPARRPAVSQADASAALADLHGTVAALHRAGVVIGDFNDLNVLVSSAAPRRAHLIDADSFQFGGYACQVFSERFVDPLLCDPAGAAPQLRQPHRPSSDWYAFAVMVMRTLLFVGPWGGVHRPTDPARRVAPSARPLRRVSVFADDVVYPRPALHFRLLPDDLLHHLEAVFVRDLRVPFPARLLDELRWTGCPACGTEHARAVCPTCRAGAPRPAAVVHVRGAVRATEVARDAVTLTSAEVPRQAPRASRVEVPQGPVAGHAEAPRQGPVAGHAGAPRQGPPAGPPAGRGAGAVRKPDVWIAGDTLWRGGALGPEPIGVVLAGQTRAWASPQLGFGFYRAGALTVGFVFDPNRRGLDDRLPMPRLRGALVDAHCTVGASRAWFFWREQRAGKELAGCAVYSARGALLGSTTADADADEAGWLRAGRGSTAAGDFLFVPTDAGIARVEVDAAAAAPRVTRTFPDTEPFVDASATLQAGADGLYVLGRRSCLRLAIS